MTTTLAAPPLADVLTFVDEMPRRDLAAERTEGANAFRGLFFGAVFGLAAWAGIAGVVVAVVAAVNGG